MSANDLITRLEFFAEMGRAGEFSGAALLVAFNLLYRHTNGKTGRCDPSIGRLAMATGLQKRSVKRAIRELEDSGWWKVGHKAGAVGFGGRSNTYTPNFAKGGDQRVPTRTAEVVTNESLPWTEGGDSKGQKVRTNESPKPRKNQERDSLLVHRSTINGVSEASRFDDFWRAYPSRGSHPNPKKPAQLKFEAAVKRGVDPAVIIRSAENYARYVEREGTDRRYVAGAATWLGQERWEQYQQPSETNQRRLGTGMFSR